MINEKMTNHGSASSPSSGGDLNNSRGIESSGSAAIPARATGEPERMRRNAAIVQRAGNALPPVTTSRSGLIARLELWLKRQLKRATHWYTWEQVNFNRAACDLLQDVAHRLAAVEERLARQEAQLADAAREFRDALAATTAGLHRAEMNRTPQIEEIVRPMLERDMEQLCAEHQAQLARLLDEQRVSFKQLQLQISETGTMADRAHRNAQLRFDEIRAETGELRALVSEIARLRQTTGG